MEYYFPYEELPLVFQYNTNAAPGLRRYPMSRTSYYPSRTDMEMLAQPTFPFGYRQAPVFQFAHTNEKKPQSRERAPSFGVTEPMFRPERTSFPQSFGPFTSLRGSPGNFPQRNNIEQTPVRAPLSSQQQFSPMFQDFNSAYYESCDSFLLEKQKEINKKRMELEAIERAKNEYIENLILKKQQERELAILKQRQEIELAIKNQLLQKTDPSNLGHNQQALNNFHQSIFQLPVDKKENFNEPQQEDNKVKHQENMAQHQQENLSSSDLNVYSLYNFLVDGSVAKPIEKLTKPPQNEKNAPLQVQNQGNRANDYHKVKQAESQTQQKKQDLNETEMGTRNNPIKVISVEDFLSAIMGVQAGKNSPTQNNSEKKTVPEGELQQKKSIQNSREHKSFINQPSTKLQDNDIEKVEKAVKSQSNDISSPVNKSDISSSAKITSDVSSAIGEQNFYDTILEIVKKKLEKINSDEERSQNNKVEQTEASNSSNSNPVEPKKDLDEKKNKSDKSVPEEKVVEEHVNRNDIKSVEIKEEKQDHIKDQKASKKSKKASNPQIIEKSLPEQLKASKLTAIQKIPSVERSPSIESSDTEFQNAKTKCYEQIDLLRKNIDSHEIKRHRSRKCDIKKKLE
ncbi:hypothetical protein AYI69_g9727, partial [Smittium culicis]